MQPNLLLMLYLHFTLIYAAPMPDTSQPTEDMPSLEASHETLQENILQTNLMHIPRNLEHLVTKHTLQQPIPIETLRPLKTHYQTQFHVNQPPMPYYQNLQFNKNQGPMPFQNEELPEDLSQQIALLQQQMLVLHQLQALKMLNTVHAPVDLSMQAPVLILLPDEKAGNTDQNQFFKNNEHSQDDVHVNEELDSVIVDAPEISTEPQRYRKAILLIPNARFSIGGIISTIPWLPIEINVPDTIAWAYNGIASGIGSIISIIGGRFRPKPQENPVQPSLKQFLNVPMQMHNMYAGPAMPMPVFISPFEEVIPVHFNPL